MASTAESYTFTVGKLDAGMAILLGERAHLIEFPSILLPPGASAGSIVNIAVHQNHAAEQKRDQEFWDLQEEILTEFGVAVPTAPELKVRNVTQTSVTLEWPTITLATSKLRSLDLYRNGQRLAAIPSAATNTSTKVSGLELNSEYNFQLILRTTAGTFPSNAMKVRTHTMNDTSGICVCFGNIASGPNTDVLLENVKLALREMGAKWSDKIEIDTTHFVCTTPAPPGQEPGTAGAPSALYQRALQLSIPVIQPEWILACHTEKKMVPVAPYYLGATPAPTPSFRPQSMSATTGSSALQQQQQQAASHRQSMPPGRFPANAPGTPPATSNFVNQPQRVEEEAEEQDVGARSPTEPPAPQSKGKERATEPSSPPIPNQSSESVTSDGAPKRKGRTGTMNREFKFPTPVSSPVVPSYEPAATALPSSLSKETTISDKEDSTTPTAATTIIEVPPPPPMEKDSRSGTHTRSNFDEELGETEEISLN